MSKDINFVDQNFNGKIVRAKLTDLKTNKEYDLITKKDRNKPSRCLFAPHIPIQSTEGSTYFLGFRMDYSDVRKGNPTLDLDVFDKGKNRVLIKEPIHHTGKELESKVQKWVFKTEGKVIKLNSDEIVLNFIFQLEITVEQTIMGKAKIVQ